MVTAKKPGASPRNAWNDNLDRIIMDGRSLGELSDELGRTCGAISTRQSVLRRAQNEELREDVRRNWGTERAGAIAERHGVVQQVAYYIAAQLNLGPSVNNAGGSNNACPNKPRGYTAEQLAWAKENSAPYMKGAAEARMMLVHHADRPRMAGE